MSNTKQDKKGLIPELRFPEFENNNTWKTKTLGEFTTVLSKRNKENKNLPVYSINNKEGFLPQGEQFEGISSSERNYDISLYKVIGKNTFAYNPARINIGSIGYSGELHNIIISSLYVCFKTSMDVDDQFLLHFFKTTHFNKEVEKNVEGGIRNYLFYQNFSKISISIPSHSEQQKIASCLSSLDELIATQTEKLEALQAHKKGLMQNLFPQEGKTVPNYRFPEFADDGVWVNKKLEELAKRGSGHTPNKKKPNYYNGGIYWVSLADSNKLDNGFINETKIQISDEGIENSSAVLHPAGTVILSRDAGVGKSAVLKTEMAVSQHFIVWTCDQTKLLNWFLYFTLQKLKPEFENIAVGSTIKTIGLPYFKELNIAIPSINEQQKIASCLLTVEDLITTLANKIDQLQMHKKGLMQGLFPTISNS